MQGQTIWGFSPLRAGTKYLDDNLTVEAIIDNIWSTRLSTFSGPHLCANYLSSFFLFLCCLSLPFGGFLFLYPTLVLAGFLVLIIIRLMRF